MKISKGLIAIIAVVVIVGAWAASAYNSMVGVQEQATTALANVQSTYQRRADLIPNLVETVKGYAKHEKETLEGVINARANATSVKIDASNLDEAQMKKFQEAQGELTQALSRLIAVSENYPDLKANQQFLEFQSQLEGCENRIAVEIQKFNDTARAYNTEIRTFPTNILAGLFNFDRKPYFEAEAGADKAPKVSFD